MSKLRHLYGVLGRYSEQLLDGIVKRTDVDVADILVSEAFRSKLRARQLQAIASLTALMMLANLLNCAGLIILLIKMDTLTWPMMVWAAVVVIVASYTLWRTLRHAKRIKSETASIRAIGATVFHAAILALIWAFPAVYLMSSSNPIVIGFLAALTAGMVAGGALALYPVALAAFIYTGLLAVIALLALFTANTLSAISFGVSALMFVTVTVWTISRHSAVFVAEMHQRLQLEVQSETIGLLLKDYKENGANWLWECDENGIIENCSPRLAEVTNRKAEELNGTSSKELLETMNATPVGELSSGFYAWVSGEEIGDASEPFEIQLKVHIDEDTVSHWELHGRPRFDNAGQFNGYQGWGRDITAEVSTNERINYLATRDPMTGLLNAAEFRHLLESKIQEFAKVDAYEVFASVFYLDADKLKAVNDTFGHAAGDALILEMGGKLTSLIDDNTLVGRKGGDEFQMAVFHREEMNLELKGDEVLELLSGRFDHDGSEITYHTSIGISTAAIDEADVEVLMAEADRALYQAKENGGRDFHIYDAELGAQLARRRRLAAELGDAIKNKQLDLHFQPIANVQDMRLDSFEALLRWSHKEFGDIPPATITLAAETSGQVHDLGNYILREAIKAAADWPVEIGLSVNISVLQLLMPDFPDQLQRILAKYNFEHSRLTLEIVETRELYENEITAKNLARLRIVGIGVAVDDFGKGYSAISYLTSYPVTCLKIDETLIRDCDYRKERQAVVKAVIAIADALDIRIVAEGVERPEQLVALRNLGCNFVQGFLFGHPSAVVDIASLNAQFTELATELDLVSSVKTLAARSQ